MNLEQRVARLERENRRTRALGAGAVAVAALVLLLGQSGPVPEEVRAKKFSLVDDGNRVRAELSQEGEETSLHLFDLEGNVIQAGLSVKRSGAVLVLSRPGAESVTLSAHPSVTGLRMTGADGRDAASLLARDRESSLDLRRGRVLVRSDSEGTSDLLLADADGVTRLGLRVTAAGPLIAVADENARGRAVLGVIENVNRGSGARIVRPESSLVLYDELGTVIWEVP